METPLFVCRGDAPICMPGRRSQLYGPFVCGGDTPRESLSARADRKSSSAVHDRSSVQVHLLGPSTRAVSARAARARDMSAIWPHGIVEGGVPICMSGDAPICMPRGCTSGRRFHLETPLFVCRGDAPICMPGRRSQLYGPIVCRGDASRESLSARACPREPSARARPRSTTVARPARACPREPVRKSPSAAAKSKIPPHFLPPPP